MDIGKLLVIVFILGAAITAIVIYIKNHPGFERPEIHYKEDGGMMSGKELELLALAKAESTKKDEPEAAEKKTVPEKKKTLKCAQCGNLVEINDEKVCSECGADISGQIAEIIKQEQQFNLMIQTLDAQRAARAASEAKKDEAATKVIGAGLNLMLPGVGSIYKRRKNSKRK
jgi:hypothetical protein